MKTCISIRGCIRTVMYLWMYPGVLYLSVYQGIWYPNTVTGTTICTVKKVATPTDYDGKITLSGMIARTNATDRLRCLAVCNVGNRLTNIFYNDVTKDCVCSRSHPHKSHLTPAAQYSYYRTDELLELWMAEALGVSSEYDARYTMTKVLNESDVYPQYGDFANAWCQTQADLDPWIELGFGRLIYVVEIRIFETNNAGHARNISLRNSKGEWEKVWHRDAPKPIQAATVFIPDFQPLAERSDAIHLAVFKDVGNKYIQIDAIKVLGHD